MNWCHVIRAQGGCITYEHDDDDDDTYTALGMALNCLLYPKFGGTWGSVGPLDRP